MISATFHFPKGFLWGTATASHQVEGGNTNNNWYKWEQEGHTEHKSGLASDWWGGRWKEDFDRAAETGQNAHRLSVEWSRIQPTPDRWDGDALERYRSILQGLRERNILPMVTLHHFTDPLWLGEQGGWETDAVVPQFEQFTRKVVGALNEYCSLWCTINEPNVYALEGYLRKNFPPGKSDLKLGIQVQANMARAHAAAYRAIHELQPEARVGYALHFRPQEPARPWSPLDRLMKNVKFEGINMAFPSAISTGVLKSPLGKILVPEAKGTQDYFGLNYYSVDTVAFDLRNRAELFSRSFFREGSDLADGGMNSNTPEGFFWALKWVVKSFPNLPILVTENGIEDSKDRIRPRFLAQHVHAMWRAVNFNWPIKGYFHWSLVDNFEWERGWTQRFGLWGLDPGTQQRTKRPSADLYAAICKENGLSSEMVQKYCPEVFEKLFPG
ncbi:MAG TPA: family 1 glycosylhydrolase [Anaerolineales bacterium]